MGEPEDETDSFLKSLLVVGLVAVVLLFGVALPICIAVTN